MNEGANQIPILVKAIQVLETIAQAPDGSTAAALARQLGVSGASCYRILQTFAAQGWVRSLPRGGHGLGAGLLPIARSLTSHDPLAAWYAPIEAFARDRGWTCKLSIRRGGQAVTVHRCEGSRAYAVAVRPGSSFPVVLGSSGAALLADATDAELEELIAAAPAECWKHQKPEDLLAKVALARSGSVIIDRGGYRPELVTCSIPLRGAAGRIEASATAIGFAGDTAAGELESISADFAAAFTAIRTGA